MRIPRPLAERVLAHARSGYPFEACGVFLGRPQGAGPAVVEDVMPVVNRETEKPRVRYQIAPEDLIRIDRDARQRGLEILGYFHSHPDHPARPSETDREHAWPWYSYLIVSVQRGEPTALTSWVLAEDRTEFHEEEVT